MGERGVKNLEKLPLLFMDVLNPVEKMKINKWLSNNSENRQKNNWVTKETLQKNI